ncbi:MAG: DUF3224 domain-containing protein [Woeseiaceae bacterium]
MQATGTFTVKLAPQEDISHPAGRMLIDKVYAGDLQGEGNGQMISKRLEASAVYVAIETFSGKIGDLSGGFTLVHRGEMGRDGQALSIAIMTHSGTGQLEAIGGTLDIEERDGVHHYTLDYSL